MKWYFCMSEGGLNRYSAMMRVAVASARAKTTLSPHLIYDGADHPLIDRLARDGVTVHRRGTALLSSILAVPEAPGYRHRMAAGGYLRLEISQIERGDPFVLYTDCDVMFQRDVDLDQLQPDVLAAAPETALTDWTFFNSGVMLLNVAALRDAYIDLLALARERLGTPHAYDQAVYNEFFAGRWERLPVNYNWKPYWGENRDAPIVHFHGPKLPALRYLIHGGPPTVIHQAWRALYERDPVAYRRFYQRACAYLDAARETPVAALAIGARLRSA